MKQFKKRKNIKSEKELKQFFNKVKSNIKDLPVLNDLSEEDIVNNDSYKDLCYLVIIFFSDVMIERDFESLQYDSQRIREYGEIVLKDMFDYYNKKFNLQVVTTFW